MNSENIIGVNVANAVSIVIMAAIGGVILTAIRKAVRDRGAAPMTSGPLANDFT